MAKIMFRQSNSANISTPSASHSNLFIDVADGYIKVRNPDGTITNYAPSGSVAEANAYTDSKIAALVGAAPELLDTLQELSDAINDDPNFSTSITALISQESSDRIAALAAEQAAREAADLALQDAIDAEQLAREGADSTLQGNIEAEALARQAADSALDTRLSTMEALKTAQLVYVSKSGNDTTGNGGQHKPFLTLGAALASITDASPTKRYLVKIEAGHYTESAIALKANVFIAGEQKEAVRITATSFALASDFTGSADNRSGLSQVILIGACDFNWTTVTSAAGKLYCNEVSFSNNVNLYGYNNAIAQAQFDSCIFFGTFTVSGINVGIHSNNFHYGNIALNQHPNGGMPTLLVASGGSCPANVTLTTTVTDFNRRCALFARNFWMGGLTINGASSYADVTDSSLPAAGATVSNNGNLVKINPPTANASLSNLAYPTAVNQPIMPATTNATNFGDWGKQWMWMFGYIHASSGTEAYFGSYPAAFGADTAGKDVFVQADLAGLATDANGGNVTLSTAAVSGSGVRGKVKIDARLLDMTNSKITNLADPSDAQDAATKSYVDTQASSSLTSAQAYTDQKVSDLVNSAPAVLDTLKELADALGGDENFASTVAGQIGDLDSRLDALEADPVTKTYVDSADSALQTAIDGKQASLGTGTANQYLRGDLTWHNEKYVTTLSWSGSGPYTMSLPATTHGQGEDPVIAIRELIDSEWVDCVTVEVRTNSAGDITISSAEMFDGKVVVK